MFKGAAFRKFLSPQPRQAERIITDFSISVKKNPAKSKDEDNIDALCVNCQEMININIIDEHSQVCDKVTEKSVQMDEKLNDERIDFKLAHLKKALESQAELQYIKSAEKNLRLQLVDCIEKILRFNQKSDLQQIRTLKELLAGIQELSNNFQGYPSLVLYLERIKVLGKEKYQDLIKTDQENVCNWKDQFSGQKSIMSQILSKKVTDTYNNRNTSHSKPASRAVASPSIEYGNCEPRAWNTPSHPAFTSRDLEASNKNAKLQKNQSSGCIGLSLKSDPELRTTKNNENFAINQSPTRYGNSTRAQPNKISLGSSPIKEYINFHPFLKQNENNEFRGSLPLFSNLRPRIENSNSSNKLIDDELRMSLPAQSFLSKNNSLCMSPLGNRDRNVSRENPIFSRSEQKPPTRYNSPDKDRQRDSLMSSSYLSNMISGEFCSPSQRHRNCENSEQRSVSRDSIKLDLEQKLEIKKKELAKVTSLVKKYKHRTATIQISLNDSNSSQKDELQSRGRTSFKMCQPSSATRPSYRGGEHENAGKIASQSWLYKNPTQDNDSFEEKISINSLRLNDETSLDEYNQNATLEEADTETNTEQRMFYSKCLAIKMKFKSNPISQHIPVGLIYKDAVKNNISQIYWERFIENAFMNPERYVDINKLHKKRRQGQGLQNRLIEIAQNKTSLNKNRSLTQLHVFNSEI